MIIINNTIKKKIIFGHEIIIKLLKIGHFQKKNKKKN